MNALLLAAGLGTRLRPLTEHTPKCLVTIGEVPLLDIWLAGLAQAGFSRFLVNTHHLANVVEDHLHSHPLHSIIETIHEQELLGTAGTLKANKDFCLQGTTLIAHADNFCLCDWKAFLEAHQRRPAGAVMTMMTFHTPTPQSCGIVELSPEGLVTAFHEKQASPPGNLANAAVYLIEPSVIECLLASTTPITDVSTGLIPNLIGRIHTWHNAGTMIDIGTPETLQSARSLFPRMEITGCVKGSLIRLIG